MNKTTTFLSRTPFGVLLSAVLLAACGGGGDDGPLQPVAVAKPTAVLAQLETVSGQCGLSSLATQAMSGQTALNVNSTTVNTNGYDQPLAYLVSGAYYEAPIRQDILLPQADLRAPVVFLEPGNNTMGVAMTGPYLLGSVACVRSVGRARAIASPTSARYELTWSSSGQPTLPVQTLPSPPVNGFEFVGNFDAQNPSAVFRLAAHTVSEPAQARICHYEGGTDWACVVPTVNLEGPSYVFSTPLSAQGVYMLSVPAAPIF